MTARPLSASLFAVFTAALLASGCSSDREGVSGPTRCPAGQESVRGVCVDRDATGDDASTDDVSADVPTLDLGLPDTNTGGPCVDGQVGCNEFGHPQTCRSGTWVDEAPCSTDQICVGGRCVAGANCDPGTVIGCAGITAQRVCNAAGNAYVERTCSDPAAPYCFGGECGTQICAPGSRSCEDDGRYTTLCAESGEEWIRSEECNPRDDLVCANGECVSGCAAALKNPAYIGCEYWSVDLPQYEDPFGDPRVVPHAVVVANTGNRTAEVLVETRSGIPLVDRTVSVEPGAVATINFPRADVENTSRSMNSFRISTSEPVVAYQFNPLNDVGVASNDASLLLPANAIGREYYVLSYPSGPSDAPLLEFPPQTGWFTIVGTSSQPTTVDITFSSNLINPPEGDHDLMNVRAGETVRFSLEQFQVMNFEAKTTISPMSTGDLSGTHIVADRPIVVFAGHEEAVIGGCCADHLEQQLFPVNTWGTRYPAVHSPPRGSEPDLWRVIAANDNTRITTVPAISGLDGITLNAGEWVEVEVGPGQTTGGSFEIVGTRPIMVAQYIVSQEHEAITNTRGDPAMVLAVPAEQYRSDYRVLTPDGYADDYFTVIRPFGAVVELDGTPLPDSSFTRFGTEEYEFAHIPVEPGPHFFEAPAGDRFGIAGFGYNNAVSYGYPGGLNLATEFEIPEF